MTVILVDLHEGRIGSDLMVSGSDRKYLSEKIFRIGDVHVAASGLSSECDAFLDWFARGRRRISRPKLGEDTFDAVVCHPDGRVEHLTSDLAPTRIPPVNRWFALGSGGSAAMGAVLAGASLERALEIACEVSPACGPPLRVIQYWTPKGIR